MSGVNDKARQLRGETTVYERKLWRMLVGGQMAGLKWRRQHPLPPYIADFFCASARVVVELDGHGHDGQIEYDEARDSWMQERGVLVLRFTNIEFVKNSEGVWETIREVCLKRIEDGEGNTKLPVAVPKD